MAGYGGLDHAGLLFIQIEDVATCRRWLRALGPRLTSSAAQLCDRRKEGEHQKKRGLNIAFTARGLETLGVPDGVLRTFSTEFLVGMARRSELLGDVGDCAPESWQFGGDDEAPIHLVLMLFAHEHTRDWLERYRETVKVHGMRVLYHQLAERLTEPPDPAAIGGTDAPSRKAGRELYEHFGFRDGLAQPEICGLPQPWKHTNEEILVPTANRLEAGEIILGHPDAQGDLYGTPARELSGDPRSDPRFDGSYLVLRKLEQDVGAFRKFVAEKAAEAGGDFEEERRKLMAKMVGRWPDGRLLDPHSGSTSVGDGDKPSKDFLFGEDAEGLHCPVTSHIRRSNPRDALVTPTGPTKRQDKKARELSLKVSRRHRMLRRGITYQDETGEKGLLFIALVADLRRQFEFVQQNWLINKKFGGRLNEPDPLLTSGDGSAQFTVPERDGPRRCIKGLPRFVRMRGGEYFFMPGIEGYYRLLDLGERATSTGGPEHPASPSMAAEPS